MIVRSGYGDPNLDYLERMERRGTAIVEVKKLTEQVVSRWDHSGSTQCPSFSCVERT